MLIVKEITAISYHATSKLYSITDLELEVIIIGI